MFTFNLVLEEYILMSLEFYLVKDKGFPKENVNQAHRFSHFHAVRHINCASNIPGNHLQPAIALIWPASWPPASSWHCRRPSSP